MQKIQKSIDLFDFLIDFLNCSSRKFEFSIFLRRCPGLGPGDRARAWAGACEEGWKMFFFSARVFQVVWAQKGKNPSFFCYFFGRFPYIWPLAGPNIAKKGGPLQKLARVDRQTHFGAFNFWLKPGF